MDFLGEAQQRMVKSYHVFQTFMYDYQAVVNLVCVIILLGAIGFSYLLMEKANRRKFHAKRGSSQMTRKERIQYRKVLVADAITEALEDLEYSGKLTRLEVQQEYKKLGRYLDNGELSPRTLPPEIVKKNLKSSSKDLKPVNIPGPMPGEKVTPTLLRRRFGEKAFGLKVA